MGRIFLTNVRQGARQNSALRKMNEGGISKQLSAAEKRKRMLEAGAKYAAQNRKGKGKPVVGSNFIELTVETKENGAVEVGESKISTLAGGSMIPMLTKSQQPSEKRHDLVTDTAGSQQPVVETASCNDKKMFIRELITRTPLKPVNETFMRDDAALTSILTRRPQNSISGRASFFRGRERPSLFPNGVNPLDVAAEKFAKPLPNAVFAARTYSVEATALTKVGPSALSNTPSSIMKFTRRTPTKTVRFDETAVFRSPENYRRASSEPPVNFDRMVLNLEMALDDMVEKLRMLPEHVFDNLESAVQMASSKRKFWSSKVLVRNVHEGTFRSSMDPPAQPETSETSSNCLLATRTDEPKDSIALRTRQQTHLSQAYAHQKLASTPKKGSTFIGFSCGETCHPENPVQRYYETPLSHFRPHRNNK